MIRLSKVAHFQTAIRAIANFISEGNFRFNDKGISLKAIDPSQIVLVQYEAPKSFFDEFKVEPNLVGIDIDEFNKVMKRALQKDTIEMELNDSHLVVRLKGDLERNFRLSLIDLSEEEAEIPQQEYDARVEAKARVLQEAFRDAMLFGSSVVLKIEKGRFLIEARGSQGTLKTEAKAAELFKVKAKKDVTSKYSLNFLENIVKEADPESTILMELKSEAPMRISYPIGETTIQFYLAHMIL
ncbi:MAG: proliferating cell nuclear antigen (pcna) [Candidatus Diapherotrites archaeon]